MAELSLNINYCLNIGTVVHELMHITGFYHAQNRNDSTAYITVHETNIHDDYLDQFVIHDTSYDRILTPWDYKSIMLYGSTAFSKDGQSKTMTPKVQGVNLPEVYDKPGLSKVDVVAIRKLYKCSNYTGLDFIQIDQMIEWFELLDKCDKSDKSLIYLFLLHLND